METYRLNFTSAVGEICEVALFLTNDSEDIIVDILHFSPPCQTFSSAKTIAAATDSANEACIFSSRELLLKVKPRVATMEETSGLQERHKQFLYATIHTFVDLGYSIRWKFSEAIQQSFKYTSKLQTIIPIAPIPATLSSRLFLRTPLQRPSLAMMVTTSILMVPEPTHLERRRACKQSPWSIASAALVC
ncbi:hypothetical protein D8B26_007725 [Coccidioides posadasii str. Silveira]|uniref:uncharacterized protein n=1 Tax=Coccidioides posadasii (strain RMSCC 757 / Silveira) TaxID=443226 RepID=UPI001BF0D1C0|nr:hypothetical protein D8B26_007725 [Coccidioides posadasii str. Silveira]